MTLQFSTQMVGLLDDVTLLNRAVYGGPDALKSKYLDDYDAARDPDNVGNRDALFVYDRYDQYVKQFGFNTLSSTELGFADNAIGASDKSDGLDHNYTYAGDLFRNNYETTDAGEAPFTAAGAVALVAVKPTDAGNTLYLTFRGTDADGPTADGEAGTANGQMRYYDQLKALIDQVYDYVSDPGHKISDIVVSGHSLGGTVADMFALYDGARFAAIDGVKLSVIALASAGIDPGLLGLMPDYDKSLVNIGKGGAVTFNTPDWYFQYDQANDIVRNPDKYDSAEHLSQDPGQAFVTGIAVSLLKDHIHFEDNRLQFETPDIDQYAVSKNLETTFLVNHYADFYEMIGTEFSKAWPAAENMTFDRFIALFGANERLDGTPGTNNVNGWGVSVDNTADYHNQTSNLFLLGFSGDDTITTGKGADFIAGGADDDKIRSGGKADILLGDIKGQTGNDVLFAGSGADILDGGRGDDRLKGGGGSDTFVFKTRSGADVVTDFHAAGSAHDVIDLTHMRGIGDWDNLKGHHMESTDDGVILEGAHGETILLKHVALADLQQADFLV
jgi:Ca2+-binding RTX toxin-like protein